jgi:hypothetical protein
MYRLKFLIASMVLVVPPTVHAQLVEKSAPAEVDAEPIPLRGAPAWLKDYKFKLDAFTFVRVKYSDRENPRTVRRRGFGQPSGSWATDYPDADLALCRQVEQLTKLKAEALVLELTDKKLRNYPFIYLCEPGRLQFTDAEVAALRTYLEQGGFLMVDDFWGDQEYENLRQELARVIPGREPTELPLEHEIFHCVFDLKEMPQVPAIAYALQNREQGITSQAVVGSDTSKAHYRAILNDAGRIMVLMCQNTDLSDGWERATVHEWYAKEFSAKRAFPMGVNIVFYALTQEK